MDDEITKPNVIEKYYNNQLIYYRENDSEGKRHGKVRKYYNNGNPEFEKTFVHGKKEGPQLYYHKNGNIRSKATCVNGLTQGLVECFYENEILSSRTNYDKGIEHGIRECYDENGILQKTLLIIRGKLIYANEFDKCGNYVKSGNYMLCYDLNELDAKDSALLNSLMKEFSKVVKKSKNTTNISESKRLESGNMCNSVCEKINDKNLNKLLTR